MASECQAILDSAAAGDDVGGSGDNWNSLKIIGKEFQKKLF